MGVVLTINAVDRSSLVRFPSLVVTDRINQEADLCSFTIEEYGAQTFRPAVNQEVIVTVDGTRTFGGVIVEVEQLMEGDKVIVHNVTCKDWTQHLDRKRVIERYEDTDLQAVVLDLIDRYADDYGFTDTNVGGAEVAIASVSFNELSLSECFNKLAKLTNYYWYVDAFKDVHFFKKNDEDAPFDLDATSGNFIIDSLVIKSDFSQIRNRVKIRGGEARAEERTKLWAGDGETDTFSTDHKFAEIPTVTVDGSPVTVGVDYLNQDEDFDCMWSFQQKYIRFTAGNIPAAPGSGTTNIEITGIPLKPLVVQKQNNPSVNLYGVYEFVEYNDSLKTRDEALQFAQAKLELYAAAIRAGSFLTQTAGLRSGQTINITIPSRGIAEDFLIQSVTFNQESKETYIWRAEIATLKTITMIDILQKLLLDERISEGEDETLLNFFSLSDGFEMSDELGTITVTTSEDYVVEQNDPGSDSYSNVALVNKSTISS
jgi:hypothetical protein